MFSPLGSWSQRNECLGQMSIWKLPWTEREREVIIHLTYCPWCSLKSPKEATLRFFFAWCRIGIAVLCSRGDLQFRPRPHAPEFTPSLSSDFGLMKGVSLLLQRLLSRKKKSLQGSGSYPGRLTDTEQPPIQHARLGSLLSA